MTCPNINEPRGCWNVRCQLGKECIDPKRNDAGQVQAGAVAMPNGYCKGCGGSGEQTYLSGGGPDAYDEVGVCSRCNGTCEEPLPQSNAELRAGAVALTSVAIYEIVASTRLVPAGSAIEIANRLSAALAAPGAAIAAREQGADGFLPCPFCGNKADAEHAADCYFEVYEALKNAPHSDLSLVPSVRVAWNRRLTLAPRDKAPATPQGEQGFWQSMDPWLVEFIGRGAGLVKVLYNEPHDAIDRSSTGDWIQTAIEVFKKAHSNGAALTQPTTVQQAPMGDAKHYRDAAEKALRALEVYMKLPSDRWPGPPTTAVLSLRAALKGMQPGERKR